MKPFPKFDTFTYLRNVEAGTHQTLGALAGLGALVLSFEDFQRHIAALSEDEHDAYEERAAIMEFDACMNRQEAERQAYDNIIQLRFEGKKQ